MKKLVEALLNDKDIRVLQAEKAKVHLYSTPTFLVKDDGNTEMILDENTKSLLFEIDTLIEHRTKQITSYYTKTKVEE